MPTAGERLYLILNLTNYLTFKTILVSFSTNFILALSPQAYFVWFFDEVRLWRVAGKRTTIKLTKLKIFIIYTKTSIIKILSKYE